MEQVVYEYPAYNTGVAPSLEVPAALEPIAEEDT